jgi:CheY-like chemotaxis protein
MALPASQVGKFVSTQSLERARPCASICLDTWGPLKRAGETSKESIDPGAGETILIVDDEAMIRMLVTEVLTENGYNVLEASDARTALQVMEANRHIALVVTDVGLPGGMNGRQLADAVRMQRRDFKVLFITGYAENAAISNGHLEHEMEILAKPFAMASLAIKVRKMLEN